MNFSTFLAGISDNEKCATFAVKFKNIYTQYIEREERERQQYILDHAISEEEFLQRYDEEWERNWFYLSEDKIIDLYNEMGWDFQKISKAKRLSFSEEYATYYKDYRVQDIWERISKEQQAEYACWEVMNFISILGDEKEQGELKQNLRNVMNELFHYTPDETIMSEKILSEYIKSKNGIECEFGLINIDIKNNRLGQGGNGVVYSGRINKAEVAIKFLINYTKKKLDRFKAEYINVNMARESLKYSVNYLHYEVLHLGECDIPFIIMTKYQTSLRKYREKMPEIKWENIEKLFSQLCETIKSLEENEIIHRDLKPENILLDEEGNFILSDYGIAHFESDKYAIKDLTKKNDRLANWEFSAPEQISGDKITYATDIYALGQIIYWFAFGTINRGTGGEHLQSIFDNEKATQLDAIINKCIANRAEERYQSIMEIEDEYKKYFKKDIDVYSDMHQFSRAVRSALPESYNCPFYTDNIEYIRDLINKINSCKLNRSMWYNTGMANNDFRKIKCLENGNYLLLDREIIINGIWAFIGDSCYNDLLILQVSNPPLYNVKDGQCSAVAIINEEIWEPISKIASGFYRFEDGHVESVNELNIEERYTYVDLDSDPYVVIGVHDHCSIITENDNYISQIQQFKKLSPEIILELKKKISKYKTYDVQLGI